MRVVPRTSLHSTLSRANTPACQVEPGARVVVETEVNLGPHVGEIDHPLTPDDIRVAEARCTQTVNPKFTYVCAVHKRYLR